jgi:hypothetical protein
MAVAMALGRTPGWGVLRVLRRDVSVESQLIP